MIISSSCDAPRNNPLDPENPNNNIGSIEGYIRTVKVPQTPIDSAKVVWVNDGKFVYSNSEGYFRLNNLQQNNGLLTIEKDSYLADTLMIDLTNESKISKNIFLNATPILKDLQFFSITINKFPNSQNSSLRVNVDITDAENDIDTVYIENSSLNISKKLDYNFSTRYYETAIDLEDLNTQSIDIVIGKEFTISVFDAELEKHIVGNASIKRIIKEEIETKATLGRDTIETGNPLLEWRKFSTVFEFTYLLEIYTDELEEELVWNYELSSDKIEHLTDANLGTGDYFWVIWAIDEFKNRTRSKPASFIVK
jgi:hypothetical protein